MSKNENENENEFDKIPHYREGLELIKKHYNIKTDKEALERASKIKEEASKKYLSIHEFISDPSKSIDNEEDVKELAQHIGETVEKTLMYLEMEEEEDGY